MLGVARPDLDEVAVVAGDVMHLEDFGHSARAWATRFSDAGLVAAHGHEGEQAEAEALGSTWAA